MIREDVLRADLAGAADLARPTDLYDGVLARSRRRRIATTAATGAAVLALAVAVAGLAVAIRPERPTVLDGPPLVPVQLPPGRLSMMEGLQSYMGGPGPLENKTLFLPPWPGDVGCPSGEVRFRYGNSGEGDVALNISNVVSGDVDGDGSTDAVATMVCLHGEAYQILAFTDLRAGRPRTLGRLVAVGGTLDHGRIHKVERTGDGRVRVGLSDSRYVGPSEQWREYRWDGTAFVQTSGPTSLPADPPAVAFSVDVLGATAVDSAGQKVLTLGVTVRSTGRLAPSEPFLQIGVPEGVVPAGSGWDRCLTDRMENEMYENNTSPDQVLTLLDCRLPDLPPGQSVSRTYQFIVGHIEPLVLGGRTFNATVSVGAYQGPDGALERGTPESFRIIELP